MRGEIFLNRKRWHRENVFFSHHPHGFVAELKRVVNGCDSCLRSIQSARLAGRMHSNTLAYASSLANRSAELGFGVLIRSEKTPIADRIRAGLINLDEIGSLLELFAHYFD